MSQNARKAKNQHPTNIGMTLAPNPNGGGSVGTVRCVETGCDSVKELQLPRHLPPEVIEKKLNQSGWFRRSQNTRGFKCPKCVEAQKQKGRGMTTLEPPRQGELVGVPTKEFPFTLRFYQSKGYTYMGIKLEGGVLGEPTHVDLSSLMVDNMRKLKRGAPLAFDFFNKNQGTKTVPGSANKIQRPIRGHSQYVSFSIHRLLAPKENGDLRKHGKYFYVEVVGNLLVHRDGSSLVASFTSDLPFLEIFRTGLSRASQGKYPTAPKPKAKAPEETEPEPEPELQSVSAAPPPDHVSGSNEQKFLEEGRTALQLMNEWLQRAAEFGADPNIYVDAVPATRVPGYKRIRVEVITRHEL